MCQLFLLVWFGERIYEVFKIDIVPRFCQCIFIMLLYRNENRLIKITFWQTFNKYLIAG